MTNYPSIYTSGFSSLLFQRKFACEITPSLLPWRYSTMVIGTWGCSRKLASRRCPNTRMKSTKNKHNIQHLHHLRSRWRNRRRSTPSPQQPPLAPDLHHVQFSTPDRRIARSGSTSILDEDLRNCGGATQGDSYKMQMMEGDSFFSFFFLK